MAGSLRVVTYNVHKCRGLDGRVRPDRIAQILRAIDADVVALQEVWSREDGGAEEHQADYLARALGLGARLGENRRIEGGAYGNLLLSRLPVLGARNLDLTHGNRERRGCLRVDLECPGGERLHVFNLHLGTAYGERRHQGERLISTEILNSGDLSGARLVVGDFNEWTRGHATRLLSGRFKTPDLRRHLGRTRTYPGLMPFLHLDHIYHDAALELESLELYRAQPALIASDHLPLVATFRWPRPEGAERPQL